MSLSPHNIMEMTRIGHYDILDCIGRGGMGLVYLARDTRLDRQVAIKCLRTELFEPHYRERFKREALLLAKLNHPNIVQIYDFIETPDQLALVMEYVDGQNLQARLREHLVPMAQRMTWLTQIAQGLAVAHDSGIIHRDLKAENILINQRNTAKISDLGIAKSQDFNATITDHVAGSYASMSPEQAMGEALDFKSDLFSFGILAYQMLCGAHPFGDTANKLQLMQRIISHPPVPPTKHNPTLPPEVCDLLGQLLSKNVDNRPDNTHWVANQFEKLSQLVLSAPEWSNDTEMTPQQASLSQLRRHPTNDTHATFDTRHLEKPAPHSNSLAEFIRQQKRNIIIGVVFISVLISFSIWLLQPAPPKYVAVIQPSMTANGMHESQQALVKAAIYDAIQQSMVQLDGYYLIPRTEVTDTDSTAVHRATAADELVTTDIQCQVEACAITLTRLVPSGTEADSRLVAKDIKRLDVLTNRYTSVMKAVQDNIGLLYSTKLTSTLDAASEQEYQSFINTGLTYRDSGATPELLNTLDELPSEIKRNPIVTALYKDIALDLYYETGTSLYLEKLDTRVRQQSSMDSLGLYNLFYLEVAKGNLAQATGIIQKLEGLTNNDSAMYELHAYSAMANNDYQKAISYYEASLSIRKTANNLYNIANAYRYYGNNDLAKSYAEQALTLSPKLHQANSLLGFIALLNGNIDHAIASFEKAVKQNPSDISNLTHLGLSNLLKPDYAEARKMFIAALKISPDNTTILLNQADAENLQGNMGESKRLYEKIISIAESRQKDETTLRNLAQSYAHLSRFSEALNALQQLEKADSQNIETFYTAALVHTLAENTRSAIFNIEKSLTNGLNSVWFRVSWFDPLCNESSFQALMEKHGEPDRCALQVTQLVDITADAWE